MRRIALVTTDPEIINGEDVDIDLLRDAFLTDGITADAPRWHDSEMEWGRYDLVIMRSPWDYPERLDEFLSWIDQTAKVTTVLNDPAVIQWNLDKSYMLELEQKGVKTVPTLTCESGEDLSRALNTKARSGTEIIVKPAISVGSRDTGRFIYGDPTALDLGTKILADGKHVLIQEAVASVAQQGEHSLVFFDGVYSHTLRKGAILALGGGYLGGEYTETISSASPTSAELWLSENAFSAIRQIIAETMNDVTPLYCRLDVVSMDDGPALLEAELFEPSYFLRTAPGSEDRFVAAVRRRLDSLERLK